MRVWRSFRSRRRFRSRPPRCALFPEPTGPRLARERAVIHPPEAAYAVGSRVAVGAQEVAHTGSTVCRMTNVIAREPRLMRTREAAQVLGLHIDTLRRAAVPRDCAVRERR